MDGRSSAESEAGSLNFYSCIMRKLLIVVAGLLAVTAVGCRKGGDSENGGLPENYATMSDRQRMEYIMRKVDPDSVAHFLCYSFLDRIPGAKVDTLAMAYLYAIENYKGNDAEKFGTAFELVLKELPLSDKMKTQFALGLADSLSVGYDLGLGYVGQIRRRGMKVAEIDEDIKNFRQACGHDINTYNRFVTGFRTALRVDRGKDLSPEVYNRYINLKEEGGGLMSNATIPDDTVTVAPEI